MLPSTIQWIRSTNTMFRIAGLAFLTITIVALIVIWTGVAAGSRVAWVIMVVIVWGWALPPDVASSSSPAALDTK